MKRHGDDKNSMERREISRAVILAAGTGSRLGFHTRDLPKALLQVGNLTIFDRMVIALDRIGISKIDVVVGHAGEKLRSHITAKTNNLIQNTIKFDFIENPRLEVGNIYSFWLAKRSMDEDFILLNSDVVLHENILASLQSSPHRSVLCIDDHKELGNEEMKVIVGDGGVIKEISKKIDPKLATGEYIGAMKVSASDSLKILEKSQKMLEEQQFPLYYEDAIRAVAREDDCFFSCSTEGLSWTEIDTPDDLDFAINSVLPSLRSAAVVELTSDRAGT